MTMTTRLAAFAAIAAVAGVALSAGSAAAQFKLIVTHPTPPLVPNSVMDLAETLGTYEKVGLDLVYDGEQHRTEMYDFAVKHIQNFEPRGYVRSFDNRYYLKQAVVGPVKPSELYHLDELRTIRKYAARTSAAPAACSAGSPRSSAAKA